MLLGWENCSLAGSSRKTDQAKPGYPRNDGIPDEDACWESSTTIIASIKKEDMCEDNWLVHNNVEGQKNSCESYWKRFIGKNLLFGYFWSLTWSD